MGRLHKLCRKFAQVLIIPALFLALPGTTMHAAEITYSKTFVDGEVLTANDLETMKSDITAVVNAGGGPVTLTSSQTVSGFAHARFRRARPCDVRRRVVAALRSSAAAGSSDRAQ